MQHTDLQLLSTDEQSLRFSRLREAMNQARIQVALINDNANLFYLTGRVFSGFVMDCADPEIAPLYFPRRPVGLSGYGVFYIRKPEEIPALAARCGIGKVERLGLELDVQSWAVCERLRQLFPEAELKNVDVCLRKTREVKTPAEIALIAESGLKQTEVYRKIPEMYRPGMTDLRFQIEIERALRLAGCLGQFRISGDSMELFMGNIITGDNADNPTPYDFAMGGAGQHPSLPVGADGSVIRPGTTVMVDINGNFNGYMTDMTRVFRLGEIPEIALAAHDCSREICRRLAEIGRPGTEAKLLYETAVAIASGCGFEKYFMGHSQKAGFVGHGVGIEINELPVIAPRSRDILQPGNVIALEPKFVIPGVGAVGIENTYVVRENGPMEVLTLAPEEIISL